VGSLDRAITHNVSEGLNVSDKNVAKAREIINVLNQVAGKDPKADEMTSVWCQGFISAMADFDLITEDEFDELLKEYCAAIQ
jgi:hypothetical protein